MVFCSLKLSKISKCGPFYVQNGEKRESVCESARYAPPGAKERTCFHRIASLTTLCKAPIVCPWSIFQRYMYLIRAYACVKKALLLADRGWKWQMLYQPIIVIGRILGRVYSSKENNIAWYAQFTSGLREQPLSTCRLKLFNFFSYCYCWFYFS